MTAPATAPATRLALLGLLLFAGAACTKQVLIRTEPAGATVKLDNRPIGKSPVSFTDQSGIPKVYALDIEAPGYRPMQQTLNQQFDATCVTASVVGGLLCVVGFDVIPFCGALPQTSYFFRLQKAGPGQQTQQDEDGPRPPALGPITPILPPL